jgi:hypothetical protein
LEEREREREREMGETPVKIERKKISSEGKRKGELTRDKE